METARQQTLMEQPEIAELFQVLEGNGLKKEQRQVEELVNYLDSMEGHFYQVLQELGEVKEQLNRIQDGGVRASATRIVKQARENVQAVGAQIQTVRKNLLQSAKSALHVFKEKGVGALKSAVSAMKISSALARIQGGLNRAVDGMNRQADKMADLNQEIHVTAGHAKNIGRVLLGKGAKEVSAESTDKGITIGIRKALLAVGGRLSGMEQTTERVRSRLEKFAGKEAQKPSVKGELKKLKEEKKTMPQLPIPVKEQARE